MTHTDLTSELRAAMARKGIRSGELMPILGKTHATVSRKMSGQIPITLDELAAIAKFLDVPLASLLPTERASA